MNVKIYTTPVCAYCKMAKEFFKNHSIKFEERNIATDGEARDEMIEKSHQLGVPVIDVNGQIFVGFNRRELEKVIKVA